MQPVFLVIGNPGNRRVDYFHQAVASHGGRILLISYQQLLEQFNNIKHVLLDKLQAFDTNHLYIRIESPGECPVVERKLIKLGAQINGIELPERSIEHGRLYGVRYWYLGFIRLLTELNVLPSLASSCGKIAKFINPPNDIALMFDKDACHKHLEQHAISVPNRLPQFDSYEALRDYMHRERSLRVFIKLNHGSSASGVAAYETKPSGQREQITTSMELCRTNKKIAFYNSLKIRRYRQQEDIQPIIQFLLDEGAHIERWVPKSQIEGHSYDLRVVTINGRAAHTVVRKSRNPLTNLHLGNQRGTLAELGWSSDVKQRVFNAVESVAATFPDTFYAGVDVMLTHRSQHPFILEVNAFGDLLPGIKHQGYDTYSSQLIQLSRYALNNSSDWVERAAGDFR